MVGHFLEHDDSAAVFIQALRRNFGDVDARVEGVVLLFTARDPKN